MDNKLPVKIISFAIVLFLIMGQQNYLMRIITWNYWAASFTVFTIAEILIGVAMLIAAFLSTNTAIKLGWSFTILLTLDFIFSILGVFYINADLMVAVSGDTNTAGDHITLRLMNRPWDAILPLLVFSFVSLFLVNKNK